MATASPRRRVNQSEMSAAIGAKTAEVPSRPDSTPRAAQNCQNSFGVSGAGHAARQPHAADQHRHQHAEAVGEPPP